MPGETEEKPSGWTVDTLNQHFDRRLVEQQRLLDERFATSTKALDAAFKAQQLAMETAFKAADAATRAALAAAEKAVTKAEASAEKRFEAVNEFRGQLSDQAALFLTRTESETKWDALAERIAALAAGHADKFAQIDKRLDLMQGKSTGVDALWGWIVAGVGVVALVISIVVTVNR